MEKIGWPLIACFAGLFACGSEALPNIVDAQAGDVVVPPAETSSDWPSVPTSYWVQAKIAPINSAMCRLAPSCSTPETDHFLIRTEPDHHVVIGARGNAYRVSVQQAADGTWVTQECPKRQSLRGGAEQTCFAIGANGFAGIEDQAYYRDFRYGPLRFRLGQTTLEGSAALASSTFYLGDTSAGLIGSADLHGVIDQQPPLIDVFGPYSSPGRVEARASWNLLALYTSEPLPTTVKAWLVSSAGERIELQPLQTTFAPDLIVGFVPSAGWVPSTGTYTVAVDSFSDLAGNPGTANLRITFTSRPDAGVDVPERD